MVLTDGHLELVFDFALRVLICNVILLVVFEQWQNPFKKPYGKHKT